MFKIKNFLMGALHAIIAFPAMVVVTNAIGLNLPNAFFFAGVTTLLFHVITKNQLPTVLGVSGAYIAALIGIATTLGTQYITGAVLCAGVVYIILGLLSLKWQEKILSYFPNWLLSMAIVMIGLSLLPIGSSLSAGSPFIAFIALIVSAAAMVSKRKTFNLLSMFWGLLAATIVSIIFFGLPVVETSNYTLAFNFGLHFNLGACLQLSLISVITYFEMLGDIKNTGEIIGKDVFNEVGTGKIAIANGLSQIVSGVFGNNAYTTYSENAGALLVTQYFNPWAQVWTAIIFIVMSFISPIFVAVSYIPMAAFGGVLLFLYGIVVLNALKQLQNNVNLETDSRVMAILATVLGMSYLTIVVMGMQLSGAAIALLLGVILNKLTENKV